MLNLDQAQRNLTKENNKLGKKHEKVCSDLKADKYDKENSVKESNALAVALKTSRKILRVTGNSLKKKEMWTTLICLRLKRILKLRRLNRLKRS